MRVKIIDIKKAFRFQDNISIPLISAITATVVREQLQKFTLASLYFKPTFY